MPDYGILSLTNALNLGRVIQSAIHCQKVAFLDTESGDVAYGTARHICADESGGFIRSDEDVRGGLLRVTMQSGFERFEPVGELVDAMDETFFTDVS